MSCLAHTVDVVAQTTVQLKLIHQWALPKYRLRLKTQTNQICFPSPSLFCSDAFHYFVDDTTFCVSNMSIN